MNNSNVDLFSANKKYVGLLMSNFSYYFHEVDVRTINSSLFQILEAKSKISPASPYPTVL